MLNTGVPRRKTSTQWLIQPTPSPGPNSDNLGYGTLWTDASDGTLHYTDTLGIDTAVAVEGSSPVFEDLGITRSILLSEQPSFLTPYPIEGFGQLYAYYDPTYTERGDLYWAQRNQQIPRRISTDLGRPYTQFSQPVITGSAVWPTFVSIIDPTNSVGLLVRRGGISQKGSLASFKSFGPIEMATTNARFAIQVLLGTTVIFQSSDLLLQQVTGSGNSFSIDLSFINKSPGVAGIAELFIIADFKYSKNNGVVESFYGSDTNNTTFETETDQVVDVKIALEGATSTLTNELCLFEQR